MKLFIFYTLIQVTWGLNQLLPDELYELNDDSDIVKQWDDIIKPDRENNMTGFFNIGSSPKFNHGSIDDINKYLLNSVIAGCGGNSQDTLTCICPLTYESPRVIEDTEEGSLSVVTVNKEFKQIVVSYRATAVKKNWLTNFDFFPVDADFFKGVKVHRGFQRHYQTLRPGTHAAVIELLDQPRYANFTLHVTGYSLGAAMSTISAIDWVNLLRKRNDNRKIEIYAYSGPRVGNKAFVDVLGSLNIPITRFTSNNDIVPHLPPRRFNFVHSGTELYYDPRIEQVRVCSQDRYEDPTCSRRHFFLSVKPHTTPFDKSRPSSPKCEKVLQESQGHLMAKHNLIMFILVFITSKFW